MHSKEPWYTEEIKELKAEKESEVVAIAPVKDLEKKEDVNAYTKKPKVKTISTSKPNNTLYAQAINNGFQLVNKSPKVVYTILYSAKKNVFIVKGKEAIIYKLDNGNWVISDVTNGNIEAKLIDIKF